MNRLTKMMSQTYTPKMAVIVYECSDTENGIYLERRDIRKGVMGAGSPLTKKCIIDIMNAIAIDSENSDYGIHGVIPPNLLYSDCTPGKIKLVWFNPPRKRNVFFSADLGIPEGSMNVPGLLYIAYDGRLSMYAFKGNRPKGKLYHAPFMNVDSKFVCLGNAKVPKPADCTYSNLISYWEEMFWRSEFSHILGDNPIEGNLSSLTKHLIESGEKFPNEVLKPVNITLKDLLR